MENNPKLSYQYLNKWDGGGQGSWQNSWGARNQISFNIKARTDWSSEVLIVTTTKSKPNLSALTQVCNNNIKRKCFSSCFSKLSPRGLRTWGGCRVISVEAGHQVPPHQGLGQHWVTHNGQQTSDTGTLELRRTACDLATANNARAERSLTKIDTNGH